MHFFTIHQKSPSLVSSGTLVFFLVSGLTKNCDLNSCMCLLIEHENGNDGIWLINLFTFKIRRRIGIKLVESTPIPVVISDDGWKKKLQKLDQANRSLLQMLLATNHCCCFRPAADHQGWWWSLLVVAIIIALYC